MWQLQSFPARFHDKIAVHFDGIDTEVYKPRMVPRQVAGRTVPSETRIVTFVARGLESVRGFDLFLRLANRLAAERQDVLFVVVGGEDTHYGWDKLFTTGLSFKRWALRQHPVDAERFVFLDHLEPQALADLLCLSDLHVYLTVPFVLSWSLLNALACGCVVLASDVPPVREVIVPEHNGLVAPLFDLDRQTDLALAVLDDPAAFAPLRPHARQVVAERYSLDAAIPGLKDLFEQCARTGRR
jgi:glycosyltransferase involved in cell wall biosynthesis